MVFSRTSQHELGNEITINLVLTIKVEGNNISVDTTTAEPVQNKKKITVHEIDDEEDDDESVSFIIPEIKNEGIIHFGEKVGEI